MTYGLNDIFKHMIIEDGKSLEEQHSFCPKGKDLLCKYWAKNEDYHENNRLPSVFVNPLKPIFQVLTEDSLLDRCLKGLTQNQNKAINGIL